MTIADSKAFARSIASKYNYTNQPLGFWVLDVEGIEKSMARWNKNMPSVHAQYAVKSCPLPEIVSAYGQLGCGFDCASIAEIKEVMRLGFPVERCIFAQTFKTYNEMIEAEKLGVKMATVDSLYEVEKHKLCCPNIGVVVRIKADDLTAGFSLGEKFGLHPEEVEPVIAKVKELGLKMPGLAFHVGSDAHSAHAFHDAMVAVRNTYTLAEKYGFHPTYIDIGGGFSQYQDFEEFARVVESSIKSLNFPKDVTFGAEPGRFFSSDALHLCVSVHGKRIRKIDGQDVHEYVVGDGLHGALAYCMMFHREVPCEALVEKAGPEFMSTFYGPSCNGSDKFSRGMCRDLIPGEDWVFVPNVGAYSMSIATNFNGYCCRDHKIYRLDDPKSKLNFNIPEDMQDRNICALLARGPCK